MSTYDPTKPSKYITYLDANNLYGWAVTMSSNWRIQIAYQKTNYQSRLREVPRWWYERNILEIDLKYPKMLHNLPNQYPLAP